MDIVSPQDFLVLDLVRRDQRVPEDLSERVEHCPRYPPVGQVVPELRTAKTQPRN
jgi:hypothetical protein